MPHQHVMESLRWALSAAARLSKYFGQCRAPGLPSANGPILAGRGPRPTELHYSPKLFFTSLPPIMVTVLLLASVSFVFAQSSQSFRNANPPNPTSTPSGGPAVTITQHSPNGFDIQVRQIEFRARLALRFKEKALTFYPERLPRARALEWPLFVDMAPLLRAALQAAIPDAGKLPAFSFSIRLIMYPEMSYRIALQAVASKKWDTSAGRPRASFMNSFVIKVANDHDTYPELKLLFAALGYRIDLVSLEKVLAVPARELPFHAELLAQGITPKSRVPFDAILWFNVQRSN